MNNKELEEFLQDVDYDIAEPSAGHYDRFVEKLGKQKVSKEPEKGKLRSLWGPLLAVAAGLILIIMLGGIFPGAGTLTQKGDLAGISPEMKETHLFYTNLIKTELAKVKEAATPETEAIVRDALVQMEKLDVDYEKLKKDLQKSGQDKRVIFAMISNLQQRIDLLNNVLEHIENINDLKNPNNENNTI